MKIHTKAVHAGDRKGSGGHTPVTTPIHTATSYFYQSMEQLDRVFSEDGSRPVSLVNGAWDTYYPTFARAVRGEGPPPVEATDAVATADVLEAARVSVERRATVRPEVDR